MNESDGWMMLAILGLTAISVVTRSFFFISERPWQLPAWAQRALPYAPIAALSAVIAPDVFLQGGVWDVSWRDARLWGALATILYYLWGRERPLPLPLAIAAGLVVYLPLQLLG